MDWQARLKDLPPWGLPAIGGGLAALVFWVSKKRHPAPVATAPVAAVQDTLPLDNLPAYNGGNADYGNSNPIDLGPVTDLIGQLSASQQDQNTAFLSALGALQAAEQSGFEQLAGLLNGTSPITAPSAPTDPTAPVVAPSPVAPAPTPVAPAPVAPAPAPAPTPTPAPTGVTGADWAALASYLGAKNFVPGGLHFAGEAVQIRWRESPYNAADPGPPSGNYPVAILPVNYNGGHDTNRYAWGVLPAAESTFVHTLRWVADYMSGHPNADTRTVWDGELGRLMRDMPGGYPSNAAQWYGTGFDLGSVRNSPYLSGDSTYPDNPAWQNIY